MWVLIDNLLIDTSEAAAISVVQGDVSKNTSRLEVLFKNHTGTHVYELTIPYADALEQLAGYATTGSPRIAPKTTKEK